MTAPTPTGNVCKFCVPKFGIGPSGKRLRHAFDCADKPGEPISAKQYAIGRGGAPWHPSHGGRF